MNIEYGDTIYQNCNEAVKGIVGDWVGGQIGDPEEMVKEIREMEWLNAFEADHGEISEEGLLEALKEVVENNLKEKAFENLIDNAELTSRALPGTDDHWAAEEWIQYSMIDGAEYAVYFLFDADEITDDDGEKMDAEHYPWDTDHISRVERFEAVGVNNA